ncbi:MAG: methylcobamide--CoM methyltransferase [Candidatus Saganbacteria bacterium]|nr:methylcobamide--CoM methyltransferase [Candidatus Saganbacteria bacterium]
MKLISANTGSYPRIGDGPNQQYLRKAITSLDKGEAVLADVARAEKDIVREVLNEQIIAGIDLVTDGQIRWYDPISHIAGKLEGVRVSGLLRFFDTNFYFRQPIVEGEIKWKGPILKDEYLFARSNSSNPVKMVITGPYTLASHSASPEEKFFRASKLNFSKLVLSYAEAIKKEVETLSSLGAEIIQIDEPSILKKDIDFNLFSEVIGEIAKVKGNSKIALYTYFGDVSGIYEKLQDLPVDTIGVDFTYNKDLPNFIEKIGSKKALGLGLVDGRNTKMEKADEVLKILEKLIPKIQ